MRARTHTALLAALAGALLLVACDDSDDSDPGGGPADAGTEQQDGAQPLDAGPQQDVGPDPADEGTGGGDGGSDPTDGGPSPDADVPVDGGPQADLGPLEPVAPQLALWLAGIFDSAAPAARDRRYWDVQVSACFVTVQGLDRPDVLYVEQAMKDSLDAPYRQRLYIVEPEDPPHLRAVSRVFEVRGAERLVGACGDPFSVRIDVADLTARSGCDVHVEWTGDRFVGGTVGHECGSTLNGASYATSEAEIRADGFTSWDRGFTADGEQVWGAVAGPYEFARTAEPGPRDELGALSGRAAEAVCGALFRCCDVEDVTLYFQAFGALAQDLAPDEPGLLADFVDRLPPNHTPEQAECVELVEAMYDVVPFGPWVQAVRDGRVTYDSDEAAFCIARLDRAECGAEVAEALYDGRCLSLVPPAGGDEQRLMFQRLGGPGAPCNRLNDGVGAAWYGTCDPSQAFCCKETDGLCGLVPVGEQGECVAVSEEGAGCTIAPSLQLCATGVECVSGGCVRPGDAELQRGDACLDEHFATLGECVQGWCDFMERICAPLKELGADCLAPFECASGTCHEGQCVERTFCTGDAPAE